MIKKLLYWLFCKPKEQTKQNNHVEKPSKFKDEFEIGAESIMSNYEPFKNWLKW